MKEEMKKKFLPLPDNPYCVAPTTGAPILMSNGAPFFEVLLRA